MQATEAFASVASHTESIRNDGPHSVRVMDPGDLWAQGDVGLLMLAGVPRWAKGIPTPTQLAPGDTQGSRHCLADTGGVTAYSVRDATPLDGPVLDAPRGMTVTHPEHGDVTLPPGVYAVVYQRAFADELRRIED